MAVADPLDFPVADVTGGDHKNRDYRVLDLVGVASPGALGVRPGELDVDLVGLPIEDHDEVSWPSAIEIRIDFRPLPSSQHGHPVFGDVSESAGASGSLPRSLQFEPLSQADNGIGADAVHLS